MNITNIKKRNNWIASRVIEAQIAQEENPSNIHIKVMNETIIIFEIPAIGCAARIGCAKCAPEDIFNFNTGLAIAWARMTGQKIPQYVIDNETDEIYVSEVKSGQRFMFNDCNFIKICNKYKKCTVYNITKDYLFDMDEDEEVIIIE